MTVEVKVPTLPESVPDATVLLWRKSIGDTVEEDEILVELETDKATQEFPAEKSGILKITMKEGEVAKIGDTIGEIDTSASNTKTEETIPEETKQTISETPVPKLTGEIIKMNVPAVGESITEVTIGSWLREDGEIVTMDEILCEIESDKATFELTSEAQGKLTIIAQEGDTLQIGAPICKIDAMEGNISSEPTLINQTEVSSSDSNEMNGATPVAANILAEKGVNPDEIQGSGARGKVMKSDAEQAEKYTPSKNKEVSTGDSVVSKVLGARNTERKKLTPLRKTISRRLVAVKNETAMLTTFNEVDMKP